MVLYKNKKILKPRIGLIIREELNVSLDHQYFRVMLEDGRVQMISDHYLELINEAW
jgi:hypothetical protein